VIRIPSVVSLSTQIPVYIFESQALAIPLNTYSLRGLKNVLYCVPTTADCVLITPVRQPVGVLRGSL
jgi:hypothetical protein